MQAHKFCVCKSFFVCLFWTSIHADKTLTQVLIGRPSWDGGFSSLFCLLRRVAFIPHADRRARFHTMSSAFLSACVLQTQKFLTHNLTQQWETLRRKLCSASLRAAYAENSARRSLVWSGLNSNKPIRWFERKIMSLKTSSSNHFSFPALAFPSATICLVTKILRLGWLAGFLYLK